MLTPGTLQYLMFHLALNILYLKQLWVGRFYLRGNCCTSLCSIVRLPSHMILISVSLVESVKSVAWKQGTGWEEKDTSNIWIFMTARELYKSSLKEKWICSLWSDKNHTADCSGEIFRMESQLSALETQEGIYFVHYEGTNFKFLIMIFWHADNAVWNNSWGRVFTPQPCILLDFFTKKFSIPGKSAQCLSFCHLQWQEAQPWGVSCRDEVVMCEFFLSGVEGGEPQSLVGLGSGCI